MENQPSHADTLTEWIRSNLGDDAVAALTSTDMHALTAAQAILELWNADSEEASDELLRCYAACVRRMQASTRQVAYHTVAKTMNWSDRPRIWERAGLPAISRPWPCRHEGNPLINHDHERRMRAARMLFVGNGPSIRWLNTPAPGLGGKKPADVHPARVESLVQGILHGNFV